MISAIEAAKEQITRLLSDRNMKFPEYPRLVSSVIVYQMPDGLGIQIRGSREPVILRGAKVEETFKYLQKSSSSGASAITMVEDCPDSVSPLSLVQLLTSLHFKGLLVSAKEDQGSFARLNGSDTMRGRQVAFWSKLAPLTGYNDGGVEVQSRIESSCIAIIGEGMLALSFMDVLRRSGIENMRLGYTGGDQERHLFEELVGGLNIQGLSLTDKHQVSEFLHNQQNVVDVVALVVNLRARTAISRVNAICQMLSLPLLVCLEAAEAFELGPLAIPGRSSCYTCSVMRRISADPIAIEEQLFQDQLGQITREDLPGAQSVAGCAVAGGLSALSIIQYISKVEQPELVGHVLHLPHFSLHREVHHVLRVPHCPDCGLQLHRM